MSYSMQNKDNYVYMYSHSVKFKTLFNDDYRRICSYFDVNRATAYRWIKAGKPTNSIALRLLDVAASGFLPCSDEWNGFMIVKGRMITPSGFDVRPNEIEYMCKELGRLPSAETNCQPRNHKPWRNREPDFVSLLKKNNPK
ncbi:DUF3653 domain-containing protein [Shewanella gelidii]|uniref:Uncharacterized protein n=1 Tax=Shewanella gelidii TaxID=1642821 RepID=A0A917NBL3_9GAMM|nr:hypothetical protein GCM10009332_24110 [Shewanella gelidii]